MEWVKKILDGLGIVKPVLIGHSLGAAICLSLPSVTAMRPPRWSRWAGA